MKVEKETEYKSILTKSKFLALHLFFENISTKLETYKQTNFYFDDGNLRLNQKGVTLRIRNKKGKWELTAKLPQNKEAIYMETTELNEEITETEALEIIKNGISSYHSFLKKVNAYEKLPESKFSCLGSLTTERTDFRLYNDTISLDMSTYNGIVDYEIEWETTEHKFATYLLNQLNIEVGNGKGKRKRFLKSRG